jgi:hypothetical protein
MKAKWYRASGALLDNDPREGTVSVFYDYDLRAWTFGVRFEVDECWYGISFEFGPIRLSLNYWRHHVCILDP